MQRAIALLSIAAVLLISGAAFSADLSGEPAEYFGNVSINLGTEDQAIHHDPMLVGGIDVYSNVASAANFGFSSTSLTSVWGDRVTTVGVGILDEHVFTIFNSAGGSLLTANVAVNFYDGVTSVFLGGYTTSINFGAGLPIGTYSVVTVSNISPLAININTTDVIVTQTVTAKTGLSNRLGIASLDPPTIGSSTNTMYISSATVGGGVPGFYNIGNPPQNANPGYRINLIAPVATEPTTWGKVKSLYR